MKKLTITLTINEQQFGNLEQNQVMQTSQNSRSIAEPNGDNSLVASICVEYKSEQTAFLHQTLGQLLKLAAQKIQSDIEMEQSLSDVRNQY